MRIELGPYGINVNAIAPGFIVTEMTDATARRLRMEPEDYRNAAAEMNPVRRVGHPEDIAAAAAFLCSDEASLRHRPDPVRRRRRQALTRVPRPGPGRGCHALTPCLLRVLACRDACASSPHWP